MTRMTKKKKKKKMMMMMMIGGVYGRHDDITIIDIMTSQMNSKL